MNHAHAARQSELYGDIWERDPNYGTAWLDVVDTVAYRIVPHLMRTYPRRPVNIVDFGAGDGRFLLDLYSRGFVLRATGVDLYVPSYVPGWMTWFKQPMWAPLSATADYVISTDALEHLPPEMVNTALANIQRAAPHGFLRISLKEDRYGTARGLHLHESVFPAHDWLQRLHAVGIEFSSYRVYFDSGRREAALEVWY